MLIVYEMRGRTPHNKPTEWVEFCGSFPNWEGFNKFKEQEARSRREVRNAREVKYND